MLLPWLKVVPREVEGFKISYLLFIIFHCMKLFSHHFQYVSEDVDFVLWKFINRTKLF